MGKIDGFSNAVGFWGNDPHCRLAADQTAAKIRALLQDELRMNGRPVDLWLPVMGASTGTVPCTCDKETTQTADYKCISCYGSRFAPGYLKFLHETLYFASAEYAGYVGPYPPVQAAFTLTGVVIDLRKKPNRLMLASGATTGTIVTPDKPFTNPGLDTWTIELAAYKKTAGDTIALEYSVNSGGTWVPVVLTGGPLFGYQGTLTGAITALTTGVLRFRVTMTRSSALTPESPSFEIVRARHVRSSDVNPVLRQRTDYTNGQILILRTWDQELVARDMTRGRTIDAVGDRGKTAPLDFFDLSITRDTPPAAFDDREAGPHPFFAYTSGIRATQRYAIYAINLDATIDNLMTHQSFSERRSQPGELYQLVW